MLQTLPTFLWKTNKKKKLNALDTAIIVKIYKCTSQAEFVFRKKFILWCQAKQGPYNLCKLYIIFTLTHGAHRHVMWDFTAQNLYNKTSHNFTFNQVCNQKN